jgi:type VI secretion system Hcp family effector
MKESFDGVSLFSESNRLGPGTARGRFTPRRGGALALLPAPLQGINNDPNRSKESAARSHEPLTIVKPWGPSSPQFMAAFWNNEPLSEVELQFLQPDGKGNPEVVFHEIHLKNATIASLELRAGKHSDAPNEAPPELEYISFRFEKMTVKNAPGKTIATFDFKNRG